MALARSTLERRRCPREARGEPSGETRALLRLRGLLPVLLLLLLPLPSAGEGGASDEVVELEVTLLS